MGTGYADIDNPLFFKENTMMLLGGGKDVCEKLRNYIETHYKGQWYFERFISDSKIEKSFKRFISHEEIYKSDNIFLFKFKVIMRKIDWWSFGRKAYF